LSDEKLLAATTGEFAPFSATERLVIDLADALVSAPANVSDDLYAQLHAQFSDEQLLELAAHIAFENYRARLNRLYNAESDQLYVPGAAAK